MGYKTYIRLFFYYLKSKMFERYSNESSKYHAKYLIALINLKSLMCSFNLFKIEIYISFFKEKELYIFIKNSKKSINTI